MNRKHKVILLSDNRNARYKDIVTSPRYKNKIQLFGTFENSYENECKTQHLYIISDKEIKEGNWFVSSKTIHKCTYIIEDTNEIMCNICDGTGFIQLGIKTNKCHKIIASTNTSLNLPQLSQSFITKYIEEYNKSNIITEVMVEYDEEPTIDGDSDKYAELHINSKDNTIIIKDAKTNWSKDEIIVLINKFAERFMPHTDKVFVKEAINNWINRNT